MGISIPDFLVWESGVLPLRRLNFPSQSVKGVVLLLRKYAFSHTSAWRNDSNPFNGFTRASKCELSDSIRFVVVGVPRCCKYPWSSGCFLESSIKTPWQAGSAENCIIRSDALFSKSSLDRFVTRTSHSEEKKYWCTGRCFGSSSARILRKKCTWHSWTTTLGNTYFAAV